MEMRREGKDSRWNIFFENNIHTNMFSLDIYKIYSRKNELRFSKQTTN